MKIYRIVVFKRKVDRQEHDYEDYALPFSLTESGGRLIWSCDINAFLCMKFLSVIKPVKSYEQRKIKAKLMSKNKGYPILYAKNRIKYLKVNRFRLALPFRESDLD